MKFKIHTCLIVILSFAFLGHSLNASSYLEDMNRHLFPMVLHHLGDITDEFALRGTSKNLRNRIEPLWDFTPEKIEEYEKRGKLSREALIRLIQRYPDSGVEILVNFGRLVTRVIPSRFILEELNAWHGFEECERQPITALQPYMRAFLIAKRHRSQQADVYYKRLMFLAEHQCNKGIIAAYWFKAMNGSIIDRFMAAHKFSGLQVYNNDHARVFDQNAANHWYRTAITESKLPRIAVPVDHFHHAMHFYDVCRDSARVIGIYTIMKSKFKIRDIPTDAIFYAVTHHFRSNKLDGAEAAVKILVKRIGHTNDVRLWLARIQICRGLERFDQKSKYFLAKEDLESATEIFEELANLTLQDHVWRVAGLVRLQRFKEATKLAEFNLLIDHDFKPTKKFLLDLGLAYFKQGQFTGNFYGCGFAAKKALRKGDLAPYDQLRFAAMAAYSRYWQTCEALVTSIKDSCIYNDNMVRFTLAYLMYLNSAWKTQAKAELKALQSDFNFNEGPFMFLDEVRIEPRFVFNTRAVFKFFDRFMDMTRAPGHRSRSPKDPVFEDQLKETEPFINAGFQAGSTLVRRYILHALNLFKTLDSTSAFRIVINHGDLTNWMSLLFDLMKKDESYFPWAFTVENEIDKYLKTIEEQTQFKLRIQQSKKSLIEMILLQIKRKRTVVGKEIVMKHGTPTQKLRLARIYATFAGTDTKQQREWTQKASDIYRSILFNIDTSQSRFNTLWEKKTKVKGSKIVETFKGYKPQSEDMYRAASLEWKALQLNDSKFKATQAEYVENELLSYIEYHEAKELEQFHNLTQGKYFLRKQSHKQLKAKVAKLWFSEFKPWALLQMQLLLHLTYDPMQESDRLIAAWCIRLATKNDEIPLEILEVQNRYNEAFSKQQYANLDDWLRKTVN